MLGTQPNVAWRNVTMPKSDTSGIQTHTLTVMVWVSSINKSRQVYVDTELLVITTTVSFHVQSKTLQSIYKEAKMCLFFKTIIDLS